MAFKKHVTVSIALLLVGSVSLIEVAPVLAQGAIEYKEDSIDPKLNEKDLAAKKKQVMLAAAEWKNLGAAVQTYYQGAVFPRMTQLGSLEQLPTMRRELLRDIDKAPSQEIRDELLKWTLAWAQAHLAGGGDKEYHPAVRINAALVLAEADQTPYVSGATPSPPIPFDGARRIFTTILKPENSKMFNDGLVTVAIHGLSRHIKLSRDAAARQDAMRSLGAILRQPCPTDRDPDAHGYLQAMALDGLMYHEDLIKNVAFVQSLLDITKDANQPSILRVRAARAIAKIPKPKDVSPAVSELTESWNLLIAEFCDHEAERLEKLEKPNLAPPIGGGYAGGGGGFGGAGYGGASYPGGGSEGGMGGPPSGMSGYGGAYGGAARGLVATKDPQPNDIILAKRRLNWVLEGLHLAWDDRPIGSAPVATARGGLATWAVKDAAQTKQVQAQIDEAVQTLVSLHEEINDESHTDVKKYAQLLRNKALILSGQAPVEEEAPTEEPANPNLMPPPFGAPGPGPVPGPAGPPIPGAAPAIGPAPGAPPGGPVAPGGSPVPPGPGSPPGAVPGPVPAAPAGAPPAAAVPGPVPPAAAAPVAVPDGFAAPNVQ